MRKTIYYSMIILAGLFFAACSKDKPFVTNNQEEESVGITLPETIRVAIPDNLTRVTLTQDEEDADGAVKLAWDEDDKIYVADHAANNKTWITYEIDTPLGENPHVATFHRVGDEITASSFDIFYGAPSLAMAESIDYSVQTQEGNANTDHLQYMALISGVNTVENVQFSSDWATEKGGHFKQSGIVRLRLQMPANVTAVSSVFLAASSAVFNTTNKLDGKKDMIKVDFSSDVDISADHIVTVYANLPWEDVSVSDGVGLTVVVKTSDGYYYSKDISNASGLAFSTGSVNAIKLNRTGFNLFAGGTGVFGDPYTIATKWHLMNTKPCTDDAEDGSVTCFKLLNDIDMSSMTWDMLNPTSPYDKLIDFDGNNKTISNLGKSLFYVLKGLVRDLTLSDCQVTSRGILAEFIQGTGHTITNVNVINGTVNSGSDNVGGLIGCINNGSGTCATISDCTVSNTSVTGKGVVGGIIGYANELVIISGCKYIGGTVKASARWAGGAIGSIGEFAAFVSDCNVNNAVVESSSDRVGGFVGQIAHEATVKGCTVGTSDQRVTVNSTMGEATANVGGFVGVCYGNVIANNDARNKAYVTITSNNTNAATKVNIGGFAGYVETATIENCDVDADLSSVKGQQVGGFAAILTNLSPGNSIDHCTAKVAVTGANYTGGFIGLAGAADQRITNNSSSGTVSGAATVGGFAGQASQGSWTNNTTSCTVTGSGANIGGFAGQINGNVNVSKCSSTGESVSASGNVCGGFAAIAANGASISDCYSTTNLLGATRKRGGLIGHVSAGTVSIERCYASGDINANFELGGLVGFVSVATFTMSKSAAWNASITASYRLSSNWSSASIVGVAEPTCTLTDNYRNPNMALTTYWGTIDYGVELTTDFQQPNVSSSTPLTDWDGNAVTSSTMRPYNGKCETGKNLSQLASTTLGWSSDVWDFSGELPTLK